MDTQGEGMTRNAWTPEQINRLRRDYAVMPTAQLATALGHPVESTRNKAKQLRLRKKNRLPRRPWTNVEITCLRERYADEPTKDLARELGRPLPQVYTKANHLGLKKSEAYRASPHACRLRRGDNIGAAYRFKPGHVPTNKGLRRPGWYAGRMRETQFKKGQISGAAQRKWLPIGTEVLDDEGYRKRKMSDDRSKPSRFNWRYVHVLLWEQHYGPVPRGYAVKFVDGDRANIVLNNLCLVSRADLARLNRMWSRYPRELCEVIQLRGALNRKINRRARHEEQDRRSA